ncbi:hypothetical protein Tco_0690296 [Tanacetum coccineum]
MLTMQFETHNMIAFLENPAESNGFQEIIDFLNANQIHYALTVNPTIYTSCIEQFWVTAKAKMVNGERGIDCLPTATIFEELAKMGNEKPSQRLTFYKAFFSPQWKFLIHTIMQCLSAKTVAWNEFSSTMASAIICLATNQKFIQVLDLEKAKDAQAKEIAGLKKRVQKLERKKKSRNTGLKRLRKVGETRRVESFMDKDRRSDDAKMFDTDDLHGDKVIMDMAVGEKQEQSAKVDEREVSTGVKDNAAPTIPVTTIGEGVTATKINEITTTSAPTTAIDEINLAQTLIKIKEAKPKVVTTATTTTTTSRPKARGVVVQEPSEFRTTTSSPQASQPSKTKDKGKEIMIELEVPLKKKDQVSLDEEMAINLGAQLQAEPIEEERFARKKEEEVNIALMESWENT